MANMAGCSGYGGPLVPPPPVNVVGLDAAVAHIAAGGSFSCAVLVNGRVRCWGGDYPLAYYPLDGGAIPTAIYAGTIPQTIVVGSNPPLAIGENRPINVTGGDSGNPVTFESLTPSVCSVSGSTVTGLANDICTVAANQAGNTYYDPAPQVTFSFRVGDLRAQTITFGPEPFVTLSAARNAHRVGELGIAGDVRFQHAEHLHRFGQHRYRRASSVRASWPRGSPATRCMRPPPRSRRASRCDRAMPCGRGCSIFPRAAMSAPGPT
jgi:hypothetical protein